MARQQGLPVLEDDVPRGPGPADRAGRPAWPPKIGWTGGSRTRDEHPRAVHPAGLERRSGAFTEYFGSDDLDASNLMMPIVGFLLAMDFWMLATIDAIEERLTDERGLVHRYDTKGGVGGPEGTEGTFLLCTFGPAQALAMAAAWAGPGGVERAIRYRNDGGCWRRKSSADGERSGTSPGLQPHRTHHRRAGHSQKPRKAAR